MPRIKLLPLVERGDCDACDAEGVAVVRINHAEFRSNKMVIAEAVLGKVCAGCLENAALAARQGQDGEGPR